MKISISNQISLTKSILFEFLIKRSAKLGTRPPSLWRSNGVAIPSVRQHGSKKTDFGNLIPNYLESSMCTHKPPTHFVQYLFIDSKWLSQNLKKICCWMLHVLRKSTSQLCHFWAFFVTHGRSGILQRTVRRTNPKFHQRACNLCSSAEIPCGRSGFCHEQSAVAPKIVPEPS